MLIFVMITNINPTVYNHDHYITSCYIDITGIQPWFIAMIDISILLPDITVLYNQMYTSIQLLFFAGFLATTSDNHYKPLLYNHDDIAI